MSGSAPPWISAADITARLSVGAAARAIQQSLRDGLDPAGDPARDVVDFVHGQLLLMPSESGGVVGVKVASVAPANPALGLPRIQALYLLMDAETLAPLALLDGTALTTLRTSAVSAAAADVLAPVTVDHMVVFGCGPQAWGHVEAMRAIRGIGRISVVARDPLRSAAFVRRASEAGIVAQLGTVDAVRSAQLIVCATTAREPLFDGDLVAEDSCTIAVGSHEPSARELDSAHLRRAQLVVEDRATALREAGDVIIPVTEGVLDPECLVPLQSIVTGEIAVEHDRPRAFKSVGMSWEDLVIAAAIFNAG